MRTTKDELREAGIKRFYAVEIAKNRYGVYYATPTFPGELMVLWPDDSDKGSHADMPAGMFYRPNHVSRPAYHFYLPGYGFNRCTEMGRAIAQWLGYTDRYAVTVELLSGSQPTSNF